MSSVESFESPLNRAVSATNLSNISVLDLNDLDVNTAISKLNGKIRLIDIYFNKCNSDYLSKLSPVDFEKRLKFIDCQVKYISDLLDFGFTSCHIELQEKSAELLDKAKNLLSFMNEHKPLKPNLDNLDGSSQVFNANIAKAESYINSIEHITNVEIASLTSESKLQSIYKTDIPFLEKRIEILDKLSNDFSKDEFRYGSIICKMAHATCKANSWIHEFIILFKSKQLDIVNESHISKDTIKLKPFNGWKSSETIYEFLNDFDKIYCFSSETTRCLALYKNYLSSDIATEVSHLYSVNDYDGIVSYLISKYGNIRYIVKAKKSKLQSLKYNVKDIEIQLTYFRSFYQILLNLETLLINNQNTLKDLENEIYNQSFIQELTQVLPEFHCKKVLKELAKAERQKRTPLSDKEEYLIIKRYISDEYSNLEQ